MDLGTGTSFDLYSLTDLSDSVISTLSTDNFVYKVTSFSGGGFVYMGSAREGSGGGQWSYSESYSNGIYKVSIYARASGYNLNTSQTATVHCYLVNY